MSKTLQLFFFFLAPQVFFFNCFNVWVYIELENFQVEGFICKGQVPFTLFLNIYFSDKKNLPSIT